MIGHYIAKILGLDRMNPPRPVRTTRPNEDSIAIQAGEEYAGLVRTGQIDPEVTSRQEYVTQRIVESEVAKRQ